MSEQKQKHNFSKQLLAIADNLECKFIAKGEPISSDKVFSDTGLVPGIMKRADQLCSFCLGYGLGITFERSDSAMLGVTVKYDDSVSSSLRLLCATDVIIEMMQNSPSSSQVSVDELMV